MHESSMMTPTAFGASGGGIIFPLGSNLKIQTQNPGFSNPLQTIFIADYNLFILKSYFQISYIRFLCAVVFIN